MMDIISTIHIPVFLLLFVRITAFFVVMPLFSYRTIPRMVKLGMSFALSLTLFQIIDAGSIPLDDTYFLLLMKEALVGLFIGFVAYIILAGVQIAGGFIDFQMGFAIANVIDPQTGAQSPLTGQYFNMIALLFLLSVNGHYLLIDGIYYSYQFIPVGQLISLENSSFSKFLLNTFNQVFVISFQMAIPIVGCLFLVDVALGIIARSVPQLNVFVVGLPLKIGVSFVAVFVFLGLYITLVKHLFETMFTTMRSLMQLLGGA